MTKVSMAWRLLSELTIIYITILSSMMVILLGGPYIALTALGFPRSTEFESNLDRIIDWIDEL